jgi:hypothetical protein
MTPIEARLREAPLMAADSSKLKAHSLWMCLILLMRGAGCEVHSAGLSFWNVDAFPDKNKDILLTTGRWRLETGLIGS